MYSKTLVVDFDDTLALQNKDDSRVISSLPNIPLIEKINALFDKGWDIHIVTARGHISTPQSREFADFTWRPILETWLQQHGVKYTSLSFQKKMAVWYIDDKALRPDEFLELEFK